MESAGGDRLEGRHVAGRLLGQVPPGKQRMSRCGEMRKCQGPHPDWVGAFGERVFGGVLLSHTLSSAVPSALEGLASGFGMGPGVSPPLWPP